MRVVLSYKVDKYLNRQGRGDPKGILAVRRFLSDYLEPATDPTSLKNAKKLQGEYKGLGNLWRWRVGHYRIIGDVKDGELVIEIIEISQRESVY